jgi:hypothetical protein
MTASQIGNQEGFRREVLFLRAFVVLLDENRPYYSLSFLYDYQCYNVSFLWRVMKRRAQ